MVDHTIGRVLDLFDIDAGLAPRWTGLQPGGARDAGAPAGEDRPADAGAKD